MPLGRSVAHGFPRQAAPQLLRARPWASSAWGSPGGLASSPAPAPSPPSALAAARGAVRGASDWGQRLSEPQSASLVRQKVLEATASVARRRGPDKASAARQEELQAADVSARRRVLDAFVDELPSLLEQGMAVETALRLPLSEPGADRAVKRLIMQVSRCLRGQGQALHAEDLSRLPLLMQRIRLQDHELFGDFCGACRSSWRSLSPQQLRNLVRGVEDYELLHPTHGPALARLAAALAEGLEPATLEPAAFASLASAALSARGARGLVRAPLLERLAAAPPSALPGGASPSAALDAAEFLSTVAELHVAVGLRPGALGELLRSGAGALREGGVAGAGAGDGEERLLRERRFLAALANACCRSCMEEPEAAGELLEVALKHLAAAGSDGGPPPPPLLAPFRDLPASLRRRLAERLSLFGSPAVGALDAEAVKVWLGLVGDLPATAASSAASPGAGAASDAAELVRALVSRLWELGGADLRPSIVAEAYLATSTAAHFTEGELSSALAEQASEALGKLNWREATPFDIQALMRSPAGVEDALVAAQKHFAEVLDPRSQASVLIAAFGSGHAAEASTKVFLKVVQGLGDRKALSRLDVALRCAAPPPPPGSDGEKGLLEVRAAVRDRFFKVSLEAPPVWSARPPRGFVQYVERCLERSRSAPSGAEQAASTEPAAASATTGAAAPAAEVAAQEPIDDLVSEVKGVEWHRGMRGWQLVTEVGGRRVVQGYFLPDVEEPVDEPADERRGDGAAARRRAFEQAMEAYEKAKDEARERAEDAAGYLQAQSGVPPPSAAAASAGQESLAP